MSKWIDKNWIMITFVGQAIFFSALFYVMQMNTL
jgi:hypothetical protein